jgi:hypothetical protein
MNRADRQNAGGGGGGKSLAVSLLLVVFLAWGFFLLMCPAY